MGLWSQKTIFASCVELTFHIDKQDITVSRIEDECKKCSVLRDRLKSLHESGQIGQVFLDVEEREQPEEDDDEDEADNKKKKVSKKKKKKECHQIWLNVCPEEKYSGAEDFPLTAKKRARQLTPLPHQTGFKHKFMPRDWDVKHPAVQMMWMLGNGKTFGILDAVFANSGGPPKTTFIVCPKSLIGMWAKAVRQYTDLTTKCRVVVCGFSYFSMIIQAPSETPYTVRDITRSCVIVDENQAYRNITDKMQADINVLQQASSLFLLSGTPITKASDVEALSLCLSVEPPKDSSPHELSKWVGVLRANNQIDFYNPEMMQPSYHRDHFPRVLHEEEFVPMSYSQVWATLMCQRKFFHSPSNTVLGNAKVDSYAVLSRGYANSYTLKDGTVISPKGDLVAKSVMQGTESGLETRHSVTSEYLENGVYPVAATLRACKSIKGVELIDGSQSAEARTKAVDKYNSGKSAVFCFSTCGRDGLDLMRTDVLHALERQRNKILEGQGFGRVIRFGSHPRDGQVRVVKYTSTLPTEPPEFGSKDWKGLMEIFKEHYAPAEFKFKGDGDGVADRAKRASSRQVGKKQAQELADKEARKYAEFWAKESDHVALVLKDIKASLKKFDITESIEEQILRTRLEAVEAVQPFVDALIVAGVSESSSLYKKYSKKLGLDVRVVGEQRAKKTQVLTPDMKTFISVCDDLKVKPFISDFVLTMQY